MKVIVAGFNKTGTKSMHVALKELGYNVYDVVDHFWYHKKEWMKIMSPGEGGNSEDFKKMYNDVDVIIDAPAFLFWEEIHEAFPDAKIILLTRDEDKFYKSFTRQIEEVKKNWLFHIVTLLSPTGWNLQNFYTRVLCCLIPIVRSHRFDFGFVKNEMVVKRSFRRHQSHCELTAPKDKLLVFHVSDGWDPLCKFLEKEVPQKPFPHANISGTILAELMKTHPALQRIKREALVALTALTGLGAFAIYQLIQNGGIGYFGSVFNQTYLNIANYFA